MTPRRTGTVIRGYGVRGIIVDGTAPGTHRLTDIMARPGIIPAGISILGTIGPGITAIVGTIRGIIVPIGTARIIMGITDITMDITTTAVPTITPTAVGHTFLPIRHVQVGFPLGVCQWADRPA